MHATPAHVGKRVRIFTTVIKPKPDRSEKPGDPTYVVEGWLTALDPDGTHHVNDRGNVSAWEANQIADVQVLV